MPILKKYAVFIFLFILLVHCICIGQDWPQARFWTKLLLVPFLVFWLLMNQSLSGKNTRSLLPLLGLLGAFLGDLLLAFSGDIYFLLGMVGFMCTHICNSIYFVKLHPVSQIKQPALIAAILLGIICLVVILQIKDHAGPFLIPIIIYMGLIGLMAVLAANLYSSPHQKNAIRYFIPGAVFFVLSDGILAMNKFLLHQQILEIPIMVTYGLAILFLTMGFVKTQEHI